MISDNDKISHALQAAKEHIMSPCIQPKQLSANLECTYNHTSRNQQYYHHVILDKFLLLTTWFFRSKI